MTLLVSCSMIQCRTGQPVPQRSRWAHHGRNSKEHNCLLFYLSLCVDIMYFCKLFWPLIISIVLTIAPFFIFLRGHTVLLKCVLLTQGRIFGLPLRLRSSPRVKSTTFFTEKRINRTRNCAGAD